MELNDSELDIKALTKRVEAQALLDALPCEDTVHVRRHGRRTPASQWCIVALFFGSSILAIMTLLFLPQSSASSFSNGAVLDCGKSQTEARERGCLFDPMSFSWLPPACHDPDLTAEFASLQPWKWYAAPSYPTTIAEGVDCFEPRCLPRMQEMKVVSNDSVWAGEHDVLFVTREYHLWHCAFMWRRYHRAVVRGGPVDGYADSMAHTEHCSRMLAVMGVSSDVDTVIAVKFPSCMPLGSKGDLGRLLSSQRVLDEVE